MEEEVIKTRYRLIPVESYIGDMFLQFEENGQWKFIPEERHCVVIGRYISIIECPTVIPKGEDNYFLHCYYEHQEYNLIPFTKIYPDIQMYFSFLKEKRDEYLKTKEEKGKAPIIYLQ